MATNHLREITEQGQAIWLDNVSRALVEDGALKSLIEADGLTGVTSNPTIFEKAIGGSDRYESDLAEAARRTDDPEELFLEVALQDIRAGADLLRGVYDATEARDGYISFEVAPSLSDDAEGTIESAKALRARIDRPNVMIKVPGTEAGVEAFAALTAAGVPVNVTLLFAVPRYEEVADAYLRGLEQRHAAGERLDGIASVASFFVSRVDSAVDKQLAAAGRSDLAGKAAVANAKLAYEAFQRIFSGDRWERLAAAGARVQRPLWASTSTKDPAYPDTMYVDELIGPDTVNTLPDATLEAARDHATAARTVDRDVDAAHAHIAALAGAGVDFDHIVGVQLVEEGVASFAKSYDSMIASITEKARSVAPAAAP
jgi:transaldolase